MNHRDLPLHTPSRTQLGARIRGGLWLVVAVAGGAVLAVVVFDTAARIATGVIW